MAAAGILTSRPMALHSTRVAARRYDGLPWQFAARGYSCMGTIEHLLKLSAPLAWQWAPQLCRRDPTTNEDCSHVHGVWQYLRLLGLHATIEPRRDFYLNALRAVRGTARAPRVLISGAADYSMLDLVVTAFKQEGLAADITVTDLCETPLALNRWYSERISCNINTVRCDILDFGTDALFDAVCTDYFLSKFPAARRGALLEKWQSLLRPGGAVITASRLRPANEGEVARFSPEQVNKLRATVARVSREMRTLLGVDPDELAERAAQYAVKYITHTVHTGEDVRALFEGGGFDVNHLSVETAPESGTQEVSGPTMRGDATCYLTVIAHRR